MSIAIDKLQKINRINSYIDDDKYIKPDEDIINDVDYILSLEDPEPRDILIGVAVKDPQKFNHILDKIQEDSHSELNILNIRTILAVYEDLPYTDFLNSSKLLLHDGIPGTTLFDMLSNELDTEDLENNNCIIKGLIINAESLALEYMLDIF